MAKKPVRKPRPKRVVEFGYAAPRVATPTGIPLGTYTTASVTPPKGRTRPGYVRVPAVPEAKKFAGAGRITKGRSLATSVEEFDRLTAK